MRSLAIAAAVLGLAATARPQSTDACRDPDPGVHLQSLASLLTETVWSIQPLQGQGEGPKDQGRDGTAAARPLAHVRDAEFELDGRLIALHVGSPRADAAADATLRRLPARDVRFDDARRRWIAVSATLRFEELEPAVAAAGARPGASPPPVPASPVLLASRLLQATFAPRATPPKDGGAGPQRDEAPPVVWLASAPQRLCFVVATLDTPRVLPWSVFRVVAAKDPPQLEAAAAPEVLATAPGGDPAEPPSFALRRASYAHFGVAAPEWDAAAARCGAPADASRQKAGG
jgi:hypothetical protein